MARKKNGPDRLCGVTNRKSCAHRVIFGYPCVDYACANLPADTLALARIILEEFIRPITTGGAIDGNGILEVLEGQDILFLGRSEDMEPTSDKE